MSARFTGQLFEDPPSELGNLIQTGGCNFSCSSSYSS